MSRKVANRWVIVGAGAFVLAGVGSAGAWAISSGNDSSAMQYAPGLGSLPQAANQGAAIAQTVRGLDASIIGDIRLGPPPSKKYPDALWMYATVHGQDHGRGDYLPAMWEADLAQGAIADRLANGQGDLAQVIVGSTVSLDTGDPSNLEDLGGGAGDVAAGQVFAAQAAGESDGQIIDDVSAALAADGLTVQKVRVLHPLGPAVYIRATTQDVASIKGDFNSLLSSVQGNGRFEGVYLEIDGGDGTPIMKSADAYRAGAGAVWFAPGIDEVLNIGHGGHPTG